ncbi:MAG: hypothetical protein ACM3QU_11545 [Verrucomicrobiota bacterium]
MKRNALVTSLVVALAVGVLAANAGAATRPSAKKFHDVVPAAKKFHNARPAAKKFHPALTNTTTLEYLRSGSRVILGIRLS